jgi:hypothetical protein
MSCSGDIGLISGKKFQLVGTPQGGELKDPSRLSLYTPHCERGLTLTYRNGALVRCGQ